MEYFTEGCIEVGYSDTVGIVLNRIFSIYKEEDKIVFTEECDGYYSIEYSKADAIKMLEEAITWIKGE